MDYFSRSWPLDFTNIDMPGRMWLGGQDRDMRLPAARKLAQRLDRLDIVEIADAGHYSVTKHYPKVLEWLREALRAQATNAQALIHERLDHSYKKGN